MTIDVIYDGERPYELRDRVSRPYLPVRLISEATGKAVDRPALLDSGADVSMVPLRTLAILGIDIDALPRVRSGGVGGVVEFVDLTLGVEVCGTKIRARVLAPVAANFDTHILGRDPFFRILHFGFAQYPDNAGNRILWRQAERA